LREELVQHEHDRQDEQQLVPNRAKRNALNDRELSICSKALHIGRRHGGIVDDYAGSFRAGTTSSNTYVIDRRSGQLGQCCNVIKQSD